jgi:hypothetical protein
MSHESIKDTFWHSVDTQQHGKTPHFRNHSFKKETMNIAENKKKYLAEYFG